MDGHTNEMGKSDWDSVSSFKVGEEMPALPVRGVVGEGPEKGNEGDHEEDEGEEDVRGDESPASPGPKVPRHEAGFELQANLAAAQMALMAQLLSNFVLQWRLYWWRGRGREGAQGGTKGVVCGHPENVERVCGDGEGVENVVQEAF